MSYPLHLPRGQYAVISSTTLRLVVCLEDRYNNNENSVKDETSISNKLTGNNQTYYTRLTSTCHYMGNVHVCCRFTHTFAYLSCWLGFTFFAMLIQEKITAKHVSVYAY